MLEYDGFISRFRELCEKMNIPYDGYMPREKTNITREKIIYQNFYDDETREKVADQFRREIKLMGYEFGRLEV